MGDGTGIERTQPPRQRGSGRQRRVLALPPRVAVAVPGDADGLPVVRVEATSNDSSARPGSLVLELALAGTAAR